MKQFGAGVLLNEPIAVLPEPRVVPHSVREGQSDGPAEQPCVLASLGIDVRSFGMSSRLISQCSVREVWR